MTSGFKAILFDWGNTLMSEDGPLDIAMGDWPEVRAIDGAHEALAALAPHFRLAVATNASVSDRAMIERALERVSLLEYFSEIFCYAELGVRKESADFWSHVCASLRLRPAQIAMVGDTPEPDVFAPMRHGVHAIWFNEGGKDRRVLAHIPVVESLRELPAILLD